MPRLVYITTHPMALRLLLAGQLAYFRQSGYDVTAVASPGPDLDVVGPREGVPTIALPMSREISPLKDLVSLWRLIRLFRRLKPEIVNAGTTKAGLLGLLAAWITRVPVRIYVLHGLRLETTRGIKRLILSITERLAAACAHRVIPVSPSVGQMAVKLGLTSAEKLRIVGHGSANGVLVQRYVKTPELAARAAQLRSGWQLDASTPIIGFVGRFTRDKGIADLVEAFDMVLQKLPAARLLLVGDFECGDPVPEACVQRITTDARIIRSGFVDNTAPYFAAMDVLVLPTYREGFPTVPLEAAAAGVPVVGYRATGLVDAVRDGTTGILVPIADRAALAEAIVAYLSDEALRGRHGAAGREIALRDYRPEIVWQGLDLEYRELLKAAGRQEGAG